MVDVSRQYVHCVDDHSPLSVDDSDVLLVTSLTLESNEKHFSYVMCGAHCKVMRETYKTVKGLASVDFANMARQLVSDIKVC